MADAAIAVAVFAATLLTTFAGHATAAGNRALVIGSAALACGALTGRSRFPLQTLAVSAAAAELFLVHLAKNEGASSGGLILLAPLIALYTVADQVERRRGLLFSGTAVTVLAAVHILHRPVLLGPANLAFIALAGLAIAAGDSSRNRRAYLAEVERRAERAELDREQDARRRIAEERLRIARDLHDAVGHQLALISVQSQVAGLAIDGDATAAREALAHVKSASRKALGELRDTIGLLRQPGDPIAPVAAPAPGLDGLQDLLASVRASGLEVDLHTDGAAIILAPAADFTAYRVVQESLTNVYKHSATRKARLTLAYDRHELRITIDDLGSVSGGTVGTLGGTVDGPEDGDGNPASGRHGIRGMYERVLALGGGFTAGPVPGCAFQVTASLPYQPLDLVAEAGP
jgi:signal transduction histidine kinase